MVLRHYRVFHFLLAGSSSYIDGYNSQDSKLRVTKSDGDLKGDNSTESVTRIRAGFDVDKCVCCTIEKEQILVHSGGGKGYGIGALAITSGCYQWKVCILCLNSQSAEIYLSVYYSFYLMALLLRII